MLAVMTRFASLALALAAALVIATAASASPGKKINTADGSGTNPVVRVSATAKKPSQLRIGVENDPAGVKVAYTITCVKSGKVKSKTGNYQTTTTTDIRKLGLPMKTAASCQLAATVRFAKPPSPATGSFVVTLYATKQK